MISITEAQQDMRDAYYGGATGAVTSATVWLTAAIVATISDPKTAILTLFFGGMLIFPASVVLCKVIGRSGQHAKNNPLGALALEGTVWMLLAIPVAIGAALYRVELFFPAMLLVIGGRYLTFNTLYGIKIYWAFGASLAAAGFSLAACEAPLAYGAYAGAIIEYIFGIAIFASTRRPAPRPEIN